MTGFPPPPKAAQKIADARVNLAAGGSGISTETNAKYLACFINPQICKNAARVSELQITASVKLHNTGWYLAVNERSVATGYWPY